MAAKKIIGLNIVTLGTSTRKIPWAAGDYKHVCLPPCVFVFFFLILWTYMLIIPSSLVVNLHVASELVRGSSLMT